MNFLLLEEAFYEFLTGKERVLITSRPDSMEQCTHRNRTGMETMMDLIYVGVVVLFFVIGGLYAHVCEKM
jgi:hypothetical protein